MGTLVKRFLGKQLGLEPGDIYHCAVMPCYDKKLEGSRDDFLIPGRSVVLVGVHAQVLAVVQCIHHLLQTALELTFGGLVGSLQIGTLSSLSLGHLLIIVPQSAILHTESCLGSTL